MRRVYNFNEFILNESSSAGSKGINFDVPFKHSSHDPKFGYNSKTFVDDLMSLFIDKPNLKNEITEFVVTNSDVSKIEDLALKPFSFVSSLIPEIERIIDAGEYEPELTMPGGSLLFLRNKKLESGKTVDFYMNRKGTKVEVVTDDEAGKEKCTIYDATNFPADQYEFTEDEKAELNALIKAKNS